MFDYIISQIEKMSQVARDTYGVNPIIFMAIYLVCVPIFYYSLIRTIRAIAKKLGNEVMLWSAIFLCATIAPFLYVVVFGRNIPWWVYIIIVLLVGQGVWSFIMKLRKKPEKESNILPK
jgi:hypothetical protein